MLLQVPRRCCAPAVPVWSGRSRSHEEVQVLVRQQIQPGVWRTLSGLSGEISPWDWRRVIAEDNIAHYWYVFTLVIWNREMRTWGSNDDSYFVEKNHMITDKISATGLLGVLLSSMYLAHCILQNDLFLPPKIMKTNILSYKDFILFPPKVTSTICMHE